MKSISGKDLCKIFERHGWSLLRIHGSKPLKTGLVRHLLQAAGLSELDI